MSQTTGTALDGRRLKQLRLAAGLSTEALAVRVCRTNATVARWENGTTDPPGTVIRALADALGVTATELLADAETRDRVAASRAEQGLPARVEDQATLARVGTLLQGGHR